MSPPSTIQHIDSSLPEGLSVQEDEYADMPELILADSQLPELILADSQLPELILADSQLKYTTNEDAIASLTVGDVFKSRVDTHLIYRGVNEEGLYTFDTQEDPSAVHTYCATGVYTFVNFYEKVTN